MPNPQPSFLALPGRQLYAAFLAIFATMAAFFAPELWRLHRVAEAPVSVVGIVTGLDCRNHGHVDYNFDVDGGTVPGSAHHVVDAPCPKLRLGQRVSVSYEHRAPNNNFAFAANDQDAARATMEFRTGCLFLSAFVFAGPLFLVAVSKVMLRALTILRPN